MTTDYLTEHVLVTPTELLHEVGHFQGFHTDVERYLKVLLEPSRLSYRPRAEMEDDPSFKQLIPYCVFRYREPGGPMRWFQYTRGTGQGETRLRAKRSVGVGGHVSTCDAAQGRSARDVYREGLLRELAEEVVISTPYRETCVGLINDDQTEVGRVHLGVVHIFDVEQPAVQPREKQMLDASFTPVDELLQEAEHFETWSQICLEALGGR